MGFGNKCFCKRKVVWPTEIAKQTVAPWTTQDFQKWRERPKHESDAQDTVEGGKELAECGLWHEVTVSDSGQSDNDEIKAIREFPALKQLVCKHTGQNVEGERAHCHLHGTITQQLVHDKLIDRIIAHSEVIFQDMVVVVRGTDFHGRPDRLGFHAKYFRPAICGGSRGRCAIPSGRLRFGVFYQWTA